MTENRKYIRTDLAQECREALCERDIDGVNYRENEKGGLKFLYMDIETEEASRHLGKEIGRYITAETGRVWLMGDEQRENAAETLAQSISEMSGDASSILIVGLGNREITSDSLGPQTADSLLVTRHIRDHDPVLFDKLCHREISVLCPGVLGQTGIETFELIRGAVETVKPDLVIAIDALAARSVDRLATTVQLTDTGIAPGSGIGNRRKRIDKNSLGVPVLALGIPTVVDSATLVWDALDRAGITSVSRELKNVLENSRSFFVSLKESDTAVRESASLLSDAINRAFSLS